MRQLDVMIREFEAVHNISYSLPSLANLSERYITLVSFGSVHVVVCRETVGCNPYLVTNLHPGDNGGESGTQGGGPVGRGRGEPGQRLAGRQVLSPPVSVSLLGSALRRPVWSLLAML